MSPGLAFKGFEPDADFQCELARRLEILLDEAPSDSVAACSIVKVSNKYSGFVKIYSTQGVFSATTFAYELGALIENMLKQAHLLLDGWHRRRFGADLGRAKDQGEPAEPILSETDRNLHESAQKSLHMAGLNNSKRKPRVLLVDDDSISITPLKMSFRNLGCEVKVVDDGYQAINEVVKEPFDLMVLDWTMPGLDGGETIRKAQKTIFLDNSLHQIWKGHPLPVVTYTGRSLENLNLPKCQHFNFVDHWQKPIRYPKLKALTSELLSRLHIN